MTRDDPLTALTISLRDLTAWLSKHGFPHAVIGGVAVAFRGRPRITEDIESVLDANAALDMDRIRGWVRNLADALEEPEIAERLEALLARRKKQS